MTLDRARSVDANRMDMLADALASARVLDLGRPLVQGMPQSPNHPPFRMALQRRHGDVVRPDGGSAASEMIVTGGHVGTHIDALCHVSHQGRLFGGVDAADAQRGGRFRALGVETVVPMLGRGVLLDVAGHLGVNCLEPGRPVTAADLQGCSAATSAKLRAGDVVFVRTGWGGHWEEATAFVGHESGVPGVDAAGAAWLADHGARAVGGETIAFEAIPPGAGHRELPVHRILLVERGVHIIETVNLDQLAAGEHFEFAIILVPLPITGATGSPVRPLALV